MVLGVEAVFLETFTRDPTGHSEESLGPRGALRFSRADYFSALPKLFDVAEVRGLLLSGA
jgi:hypothetical protein